MNVVAIITAALSLTGTQTAHQLRPAYQATHLTTICVPQAAWKKASRSWGLTPQDSGVYFFSAHTIVLSQRNECRSLEHPQSVNGIELSDALFSIAHEWGHYRQQALGLPFNEHDADCRAVPMFPRVVKAFGIKRRIPR